MQQKKLQFQPSNFSISRLRKKGISVTGMPFLHIVCLDVTRHI